MDRADIVLAIYGNSASCHIWALIVTVVAVLLYWKFLGPV
jgi:hypothetical protein